MTRTRTVGHLVAATLLLLLMQALSNFQRLANPPSKSARFLSQSLLLLVKMMKQNVLMVARLRSLCPLASLPSLEHLPPALVPTFSAEAPTQAAVGLGINLGADPSTTSPTGMTSPIMDEPLINLDTSPIKANQQVSPRPTLRSMDRSTCLHLQVPARCSCQVMNHRALPTSILWPIELSMLRLKYQPEKRPDY